MLPLLTTVRDNQEQIRQELINSLAKQFSLTDAERNELLPSGKQRKFDNRVGWAATHLVKAKLLISTGRGRLKLTDRGLAELNLNPVLINSIANLFEI